MIRAMAGAMDDIAGRIVLIVDASAPASAREACTDAAAALARRAGMPVTLAVVPIEVLDAVQPVLRRDPAQLRELAPPDQAQMSSAPFVWRRDGRPDWGAMWTAFCELALFGGPPHRGPEQAVRAPAAGTGPASREVLAELARGIQETTGLDAEPAEPGWIAITCASRRMAAWLCAAIVLENVDARADGARLLLPAGPGWVLEDQIKSVVTVVAKTHHYWREHLEPAPSP
jgi:sirohydrochlorin cobaltochelatase